MRYHNITKDDMLNGDGLRVVLWVAGCNHHCEECQNPITWDPEGGILFDAFARAEIDEQMAMSYVSGITLSGGDPLFPGHREEIGELVRDLKAKFPDKTIWMYTGYTWEEICGIEWLPLVDVVVDGRYQKELRDVSLLWKGSSNQRVIDVKRTLASKTGTVVLHCEDHLHGDRVWKGTGNTDGGAPVQECC